MASSRQQERRHGREAAAFLAGRERRRRGRNDLAAYRYEPPFGCYRGSKCRRRTSTPTNLPDMPGSMPPAESTTFDPRTEEQCVREERRNRVRELQEAEAQKQLDLLAYAKAEKKSRRCE